MHYSIRSMRDDEVEILDTFLYEAIFIPDGAQPLPYEVIALPDLRIYVEDFGSGKADHCYLAEADNQVIGAVWTRIMNDYGHVDDETPSLSISVLKAYRNCGVGSALMHRILSDLADKGYKQVSLSVQKANAAVRLYQRLGFEVFRDNEEDYIMIRRLAET